MARPVHAWRPLREAAGADKAARKNLARLKENGQLGRMISFGPELTREEKALKRVLSLSRLNGWVAVIIAALGILVTLAMGDFSGVAVGLLIGTAGQMEIRGHNSLKRGNPDGMRLLVRSQVLMLAVILAYCALRLGSFDDGTVTSNLTPDMESLLKEAGLDQAELLPMVRTAFYAGYGAFAFATLVYQGGMALYYRSKIPLVAAALANAAIPRVPPLPPSN